jgi:hypothetical protein
MTKVLTYLLVIVIAITTPLEFSRIRSVQSHQNDALQSIMCFAEKRIGESKKIPAKQRSQAVKFYAQALAKAHLTPCPRVP